MEKHDVTLTVNGRTSTVTVEPRKLLVDVLREDLGLTGTHIGCEHGVCGTCTVLRDGASIRSCTIFAVQVDGAETRTDIARSYLRRGIELALSRAQDRR